MASFLLIRKKKKPFEPFSLTCGATFETSFYCYISVSVLHSKRKRLFKGWCSKMSRAQSWAQRNLMESSSSDQEKRKMAVQKIHQREEKGAGSLSQTRSEDEKAKFREEDSCLRGNGAANSYYSCHRGSRAKQYSKRVLLILYCLKVWYSGFYY